MTAMSALSNTQQRGVYNYARRPRLRIGLCPVQLFLVIILFDHFLILFFLFFIVLRVRSDDDNNKQHFVWSEYSLYSDICLGYVILQMTLKIHSYY